MITNAYFLRLTLVVPHCKCYKYPEFSTANNNKNNDTQKCQYQLCCLCLIQLAYNFTQRDCRHAIFH